MNFLNNTRGSALVEMALIMPVFTALLVGVVSLGFAMQSGITFVDSVRAGAEVALTPGNATNTGLMQTVATNAAGSVPNYAATASNFCTCLPGAGGVIACGSACPGYGQAAFYAKVTATASLPMFFNLAPLPVSFTTRVRISCQTC